MSSTTYITIPEDDYKLFKEVATAANIILASATYGGRRWLSPKEAAKYIGVSQDTLTRALADEIPRSQRHDSGSMAYDIRDLDAWREKYKQRKPQTASKRVARES